MEARVVVISDGKRGHENQSRVIARMLGDENPLVMLLRPSVKDGGWQELLLRLKLRMGGRKRFSMAQAASLVKTYLQPEDNQAFRDFSVMLRPGSDRPQMFTVSSGTPPATFNLIMAAMLGCKAIVNMRPSLLPLGHFDLAILPAHDLRNQAAPPNVIITQLALGHFNETAAKHLASQLCRDHGLDPAGKFFGVAIGGPSKACRWDGDRILDELAALRGLAKGEGAKLLVTTSRRTPEWCMAWMTEHYKGREPLGYFLDANTDPLNPLPAFYELAERMFVSGDSFSMVSEAVQAGHQPLVLKVQPAMTTGKLGWALKNLEQAGMVVCGDDALGLPERVANMRVGRTQANLGYSALSDEVTKALAAAGN